MKNTATLIFVALAALVLIKGFIPSSSNTLFPEKRFGNLPVLEGGRFKPIDSYARTSLLLLRGKKTAEDVEGNKITATEWFLQMSLHPEKASPLKVFRIDHEEIKELLEIEDMEEHFFSYQQILPKITQIEEVVRKTPEDSARQDAVDKAFLKLYQNLQIYRRLAYGMRLPLIKQTVLEEYGNYMTVLKSAADYLHNNAEPDPNSELLKQLRRYTQIYGSLSDKRSARFFPSQAGPEWLNLSDALKEGITSGGINPTAISYAKLSDAYISGDVEAFTVALEEIEQRCLTSTNKEFQVWKTDSEAFFNRLDPFLTSMVLYIFGLVGVLFAWLTLNDKLLKAVFWVMLIAFIFHTGGILARMIIQGRPPVTNLYSASVFVGWGSVALGLILERIYRTGIGASVSAIVGFLSLIVAAHMTTSGDTMEMMRAVLDSNFWLATHVVTISLGYSATYLAGFLAIIYFFLGICSKLLTKKMEASLNRMVYGIICFSLLFSFVGTVLGGIWADQSWGRFWGWDPKENGALIIVIWNALILHAKRGGLVKSVGFMNLSIFGNIVTTWSFFGTNMLGIGLHSYGFMNAAFLWMSIFNLSMVAVMIVGGTFPKRLWRSAKELE